MIKKIIFMICFIIIIMIVFCCITFFGNINKMETIYVDVFELQVPHISVPGVKNMNIKIVNNSDKEYKSISVNVMCVTNKNDYARGFYEKNDFKPNEIINDTVRLHTLAANGEIISCSTNYYVEEYNFFDWVLHYLKD